MMKPQSLITRSFAGFFLLSRWRFRYWSPRDIRRHQKLQRAKIVKYAIHHSPFFRQHYEDYNPDAFFTLPTVDKRLMMDNLTGYNTLKLDGDELIRFALDIEVNRDFSSRFHGINIGMSSGTSGNKGIIITTPQEEKYLKAMYASRLVLPKGEKLNGAFILRVNTPAFKYERFGNKLNYVSQLQTMEQIRHRLEKINPNVISAPPSMLKLLAREQEAGSLGLKPKSLYSYAEVLEPDVKKYLMQVFNCPVHEVYQGSEGTYAMTCRAGNLHINEDIVFLELLDARGRPTIDGQPCCHLLVTDLYKKSQPIIRYAINDILTLEPGKCVCGSNFRVIRRIQGRADDLIWGLRNTTRAKHFIYQDYISRKIISISAEVDDYQVIQESFSLIRIRIKLKPAADKKVIIQKIREGVVDVFRAYDCLLPEVVIEEGDPVVNENSGKLTRVISNIKNENR
ncbi:MAG: F390 synthetase-related protein [Bacteroidales bacterium]|jgi:putative adenylate-forming enzyme